MKYNRFDLEQQIMDCWNVTTDINTLYEAVGDRPEPLTEDELMNTLLGMKQLYELKFEKLFSVFEGSLEKSELPEYTPNVVADKATRFEVINYMKGGRDYNHTIDQPFDVSISRQDGGKTLKVFLSKKETP